MITIKDQTTFIRNFYSVFLALLPAVMMYRIPVLNMGLSTVFVFVTAPYPLWRILVQRKFKACIPLGIALFWFMGKSLSSPANCLLLLLVLLHALGVINGTANITLMRRVFEFAALFFTAVLFLQYLLYYVFGIPTFLLPKALLLADNAETEVGFFKTLRETGMFRPCSLFLEPSHFAQYCIVGLTSALFPASGKANFRRAILIAAGIVMTTSGMGIAMVAAAFAWYFLFAKREKYTRLPVVIALAALGVLCFVVLLQVPFFRSAVVRVVGHDESGYNAFKGRTLYWSVYVSPLQGAGLWLGNGFLESFDGYVTSLIELIYCYGILGTAAYFAAVFFLGFRARDIGALFLAFIYAVLISISGATGFLSMIFWMSLLLLWGEEVHEEQPESLSLEKNK